MSNQPQKPAAPVKRPAATPARRYFIVNPKGAIHEVDRAHAAWRLRTVGWRMATKEEVAELDRRSGRQVHDDPICPPWSPDPDVQLDLE